MAERKLSAVIQIGGRVSSSLKKSFGGINKHIGATSQSLRKLNKVQAQAKGAAKLEAETVALRKNIAATRRAGKSTAALEKKLEKKQRTLSESRAELKKAGVNTDKLSDEMERLARETEQAGDKLKRLSRAKDSIGSVGKRFTQMRTSVVRSGGMIAGAAAAASGAIFKVAADTAAAGDSAAKAAAPLGMTSEALQEMRYAAERSGVAGSQLDRMLSKMNTNVGDAAKGVGEAISAFDELGISASSIAHLSPDKQFEAIADAMQTIPNAADRARVAVDLFGERGVKMTNIMEGGAEGVRALREDARKTGFVLGNDAARSGEAFQDAMLDAQLSMTGLRNILGSALIPAVTDLMRKFKVFVVERSPAIKQFAKDFAQGFKDSIPSLIEAAKGIYSLGKSIGSAADTLAGFVGGWKNAIGIIAALIVGKAIVSIGLFIQSIFALGTAIAPIVAAALPGLAGAFGVAAGAVKAFGVALMTTPVGWIMGAVAAIAGSAFLIYKNWEGVAGFFKSIWDTILKGLKMLFKPFEWFIKKFEFIGKAVNGLKSFLGFGGDEVGEPDAEERAETPQRRRRRRSSAWDRNPEGRKYADALNSRAAPANPPGPARQENTITINAAPGQNEEAIADAVLYKMKTANEGALYD